MEYNINVSCSTTVSGDDSEEDEDEDDDDDLLRKTGNFVAASETLPSGTLRVSTVCLSRQAGEWGALSPNSSLPVNAFLQQSGPQCAGDKGRLKAAATSLNPSTGLKWSLSPPFHLYLRQPTTLHILTTFLRPSIEIILTSCFSVWYAYCTAAGKKALQQVHKPAQPRTNLPKCPLGGATGVTDLNQLLSFLLLPGSLCICSSIKALCLHSCVVYNALCTAQPQLFFSNFLQYGHIYNAICSHK